MNTSVMCTYLTATLTEVSVSEGVDISSATSNNHSLPVEKDNVYLSKVKMLQ